MSAIILLQAFVLVTSSVRFAQGVRRHHGRQSGDLGLRVAEFGFGDSADAVDAAVEAAKVAVGGGVCGRQSGDSGLCGRQSRDVGQRGADFGFGDSADAVDAAVEAAEVAVGGGVCGDLRCPSTSTMRLHAGDMLAS